MLFAFRKSFVYLRQKLLLLHGGEEPEGKVKDRWGSSIHILFPKSIVQWHPTYEIREDVIWKALSTILVAIVASTSWISLHRSCMGLSAPQ